MQAVKLTATIPADRTLVLKVPETIPPGEAEIVVLVQDEPPQTHPSRESLLKFLDALDQSPRPPRSKEEIDAEIAAERDSWD